ncbi:hypothetical protein RHSIM_Rhsim05G0117000 [Rhododendron simsii]|uniref:Uncharacterized protein n=1 Tax=Rhododendron simsii TaxID=118357 RepID=A0A834GY47_RHOSS|nr:hypothetical protein RHSIM_Rhsim05G0117000 [Rhododendron simsii]
MGIYGIVFSCSANFSNNPKGEYRQAGEKRDDPKQNKVSLGVVFVTPDDAVQFFTSRKGRTKIRDASTRANCSLLYDVGLSSPFFVFAFLFPDVHIEIGLHLMSSPTKTTIIAFHHSVRIVVISTKQESGPPYTHLD